jgi:GNAT superfamily N-acetyltransferase
MSVAARSSALIASRVVFFSQLHFVLNCEKNEGMSAKDKENFLFADLDLSRRLERAEMLSNADFVEARARLYPKSGAQWIEVAGARAMYDGVKSPLTQTFGLGIFQRVAPADMEMIEEFYRSRRAPVFHEVSPLAETAAIALLNERGYQPVEFTSVMFRSLSGELPSSTNEKIRVRMIGEDEQDLWAETAAKGWSELTEFAEVIEELMQVTAKRAGALSFLAEVDGQAAAAGAMMIHDRVALLAGASTIAEHRKQGAQLALLESRLRYAARHGCDLAMMCAQPGSGSQRNAERNGFRIAYTRIKWHLSRNP